LLIKQRPQSRVAPKTWDSTPKPSSTPWPLITLLWVRLLSDW